MIYALDTNVIIEYLRKNKTMAQTILIKTQSAILTIPPFAEYEVMRGIYDKNAEIQELQFEKLLSRCVLLKLNERKVMYRAAKLHAERKKAGLPIEDVDLFIAAWCMESGAVLVTENVKHFEDIPGLTYENWNKR
jgi:predicted nucleic acid-binding protein